MAVALTIYQAGCGGHGSTTSPVFLKPKLIAPFFFKRSPSSVLSSSAGLLLPRRWSRWIPGVVFCAAAGVAVAVAVGSSVGWSVVVAALTLAAMWSIGSALVRHSPPELQPLRHQPLAIMAVGFVIFSLVVFAIGRLGALRWWSVGVPTVLLGAISLWVLLRKAAQRLKPRASSDPGHAFRDEVRKPF